jgi:hypothetical protein
MTAEEWVTAFCKARRLDWSKLTGSQRFHIQMSIPCAIRCFRVGVDVDVKPGEVCPECGQKADLPTSWDKIPLELDP